MHHPIQTQVTVRMSKRGRMCGSYAQGLHLSKASATLTNCFISTTPNKVHVLAHLASYPGPLEKA